MAAHDTIAPLQIQKQARNAQPAPPSQPSVAVLVEYTQGLLDAEDQEHAQAATGDRAATAQVSHNLSPGATVDLSKKSIHELPVEVIELMKDRVERYSMLYTTAQASFAC